MSSVCREYMYLQGVSTIFSVSFQMEARERHLSVENICTCRECPRFPLLSLQTGARECQRSVENICTCRECPGFPPLASRWKQGSVNCPSRIIGPARNVSSISSVSFQIEARECQRSVENICTCRECPRYPPLASR